MSLAPLTQDLTPRVVYGRVIEPGETVGRDLVGLTHGVDVATALFSKFHFGLHCVDVHSGSIPHRADTILAIHCGFQTS